MRDYERLNKSPSPNIPAEAYLTERQLKHDAFFQDLIKLVSAYYNANRDVVVEDQASVLLVVGQQVLYKGEPSGAGQVVYFGNGDVLAGSIINKCIEAPTLTPVIHTASRELIKLGQIY
jgi:hypothetical protein